MPADPSNLTRQPDKSNTVAHTGDWKAVPWHVEEGESAVRHKDGWLVTSTCSDEYARLIAAAPDLLEALKGLHYLVALADKVIAWESHGLGNTFAEAMERDLNRARQAILRAQGAEQ